METKICGIHTCEACGCEFALIYEKRYTVRDEMTGGIMAALGSEDEPLMWDAFDCPHCGCQNRVIVRKRTVGERVETPEEVPTWPRFEDGKSVQFGDEVLDTNGHGFVVHSVRFDNDGDVVLSSWHGYGVCTKETVARPTPHQMKDYYAKWPMEREARDGR